MSKKSIQKPRVLVFSGYGLNCEEEAAFAFNQAGGKADIVHINDVIDGKAKLKNYDILMFPGGFAYGDDTGSGKAYANRVKNHLAKELDAFLKSGKLVLGICNGFQILTQLGILPGALAHNASNRYVDRWVDLKAEGDSPWLTGIKTLSVPVAHGEGKYVAPKKELTALKKNKQVAFRYVKGDVTKYQNLPANPNGAMEDIAGVLNYDGRVLGLMPHPDRALFNMQLPHAGVLKEKAKRAGKKLPYYTESLKIFKNGVDYAKR